MRMRRIHAWRGADVSAPDPYALPPGLVKIQPGMFATTFFDGVEAFSGRVVAGKRAGFGRLEGERESGFSTFGPTSDVRPDLRPGPDGKSDAATCWLVAVWINDAWCEAGDGSKWGALCAAGEHDGRVLARLAREIGESR
jgi:hypothetical protein